GCLSRTFLPLREVAGRGAVRTITEWLASLGLSEYAGRFAEEKIDLSILSDLTEEDFEKLGVRLGHRRKLLRAINELKDGAVLRPAAEPVPRDEAERRPLTVMFCDLVGSTALSARLDPEDFRRVIWAYSSCVAEVIRTCRGEIVRYMG